MLLLLLLVVVGVGVGVGVGVFVVVVVAVGVFVVVVGVVVAGVMLFVCLCGWPCVDMWLVPLRDARGERGAVLTGDWLQHLFLFVLGRT